MRKVKLGDVCTILRGGSPRPIQNYLTVDDDGVNWIKIGDVAPNEKYITQTAEKIKPSGVNKSREVKPGDLLLSNSMSFGRPYILNINGCIHDGWLVIQDNNGVFYKDFLYHFLSSPTTYATFKTMVEGGVVRNLNSEVVRKLLVPLPSLPDQRRIATELDTVCDAISKQKQQLKLYDGLIKSKFNEMFGDPNINLVKVGIKLRDCTTVVGGSTPKTNVAEYWNGNLCWIAPAEITIDSFIIRDTERKIAQAGAKSCSLTRMPIETVLLSSRAPIGKVAITGVEMYCNQGFKNFICDKTKILPIYLYFLLKYNTEQLNERGRGATFKELSKSTIEEIIISIPPLELQQQFADFVNQVEQNKTKIKQSLKETETLYKALMQKYFVEEEDK